MQTILGAGGVIGSELAKSLPHGELGGEGHRVCALSGAGGEVVSILIGVTG